MATATIDEALEEHRDLVREIVKESLEEIALIRAIRQGLETPPVSRDEVFAILEGGR